MGRFNYTNRVDLFWSVDEDEKDIMIMVNTLSREFYVVLSFNQILEKIKKKHKNLIETNSKIFCEIFRGAFRKEVELGTLNNPVYDSIFNNEIKLDSRIQRDLEDVDPHRVNFRLIITNIDNKILAASNSIKPFFIEHKEDIQKIFINKNIPLFGTKVEELNRPWDVGFENDGDKSKMIPVIYFDKKLDVASDCETDNRLLVSIFSMGFKELLRRCVILSEVSDNLHIQEFLKYADSANSSNKKFDEISQDLEERFEYENLFINEDLETYLNNALEKYLEDMDLMAKYERAKENIEVYEEE